MRFIEFKLLLILFLLLGQLTYGQVPKAWIPEKVKDRTQKLIGNIKARFAEIDKKKIECKNEILNELIKSNLTKCNKYQIMEKRKHKCNYQK